MPKKPEPSLAKAIECFSYNELPEAEQHLLACQNPTWIVWTNLAHVRCQLGKYKSAEKVCFFWSWNLSVETVPKMCELKLYWNVYLEIQKLYFEKMKAKKSKTRS